DRAIADGPATLVFGQADLARRPAPYCGQSLQSVIPIMISEPIATITGQMNGNSSSTLITTARMRRVFFVCAKRQPAIPIGHLRLVPSNGWSDSSTRSDPRL